jgi:hypothetical protein
MLRAIEDLRNLFDIAINIHADNDPAVDAILAALNRPLDRPMADCTALGDVSLC